MDIIKKIEDLLDSFERIYVLNISSSECKVLLQAAKKNIYNDSLRKTVFLTSYDDHLSADDLLSIMVINAEEMCELNQLYDLYEFSDRISFIRHSTLYCSLFNYRNSGIITDEELVHALFLKRGENDGCSAL